MLKCLPNVDNGISRICVREQQKSFSRRLCARALPTTTTPGKNRPPTTHDPEKWRPVFRTRSCAKKGRRSAERRMPTISAQQRRMSPFADAFRAAARHFRGRARLPALHRGTHHRLSPRWLSPRTGFPQSTAKRVFCPLAAQRFELSTLRADRSFCRPTGDPGPPGSGSH
jgi:hypothetical protein